MDSDPQPRPRVTTTTIIYDVADRVHGLRDPSGPGQEPPPNPRATRFDFEHDRDKGIFRITGPDVEVEVFRDKPVRHLVVEPDFETGAMKPIVKGGVPTYLYLAREEREVR